MDNGLSIGDALALTKNNDDNGFLSGGNGVTATYDTQADIQRGFDTNQIINKLGVTNSGLCDGLYVMNTSVLNVFNGVSGGITELWHFLNNLNDVYRELAEICSDNMDECSMAKSNVKEVYQIFN